MEYIGMWSLSRENLFDNEKNIPGTLSIENKKIILKLNGSFEEFTNSSDFKEYPELYGFTKEGRFILLTRCSVKNFRFSAPGYETRSYSCETCLDFKNIDCYDNLMIDKISFELNALENYFENDTFNGEQSEDLQSYSFTCNSKPKQIEFRIDDRKYEISRSWVTNENNKDNNIFTCRSRILINLIDLNIYKDNLTDFYYNKFLHDYNMVIKYFNLLLNKFVLLKKIQMFSNKKVIANVYDIRLNDTLDNKISPIDKIYLSYKDVEISLKDYVIKYEKYKNIVKSAMEYIFKFKQEKTLSPITSFINVCGVLEDYYRNIIEMERTPENDKFDEMLKSINLKLNNSEQEWLAKKLRYSNQISFRNIIKKLFKDVDKIGDNKISLLINSRNKSKLIDKIYNSRNWHTHYGDNIKTLNELQLVYVTEIIWTCIRYLLLRDFKVNEISLKNYIKRDDNISFWLHKLLNEH